MVKTIKSVALYDKQKEIYKQIVTSDKLFHVVKASRQCGKTVMVTQVVCNFAINNRNATILYVTPTYYLAKTIIFPKIVSGLQRTGVIKSVNKQDLIIEFVTGSKIIFKTAESPDSILGITSDFIIVDEAAIIKDEVFNRYILPTANAKGKKIILISTPRGTNYFHKYYHSIDCKSYSIHYKESPYTNYTLLDIAKKTTPERIFNCEYENQFLEGTGFVFRNIDSCATIKIYEKPIAGKKYFAGLDLGRKIDYSVLTITDENRKVCAVFKISKSNWKNMINDIVKHLKKYKAYCVIEINGVGDPVYEQIRDQYKNVEEWLSTNKSKQEIIEDLILLFDDKAIAIPEKELEPELYDQLVNFDVKYSEKSNAVFYSAPSGQHDDFVISLALSQTKVKKRAKGYSTLVV